MVETEPPPGYGNDVFRLSTVETSAIYVSTNMRSLQRLSEQTNKQTNKRCAVVKYCTEEVNATKDGLCKRQSSTPATAPPRYTH